MSRRKRRQKPKSKSQMKRQTVQDGKQPPSCEPDWETPCEVCGAVPTVTGIGMCGPCTFGEAETAGGNW